MKNFAAPFAFLLLSLSFLQAQPAAAVPSPENKGPYAEKPNSLTTEEVIAPRTVSAEDSIPGQIKSFFKDMFKSVKLGGIKGSYVDTTLKVDPSEVDLKDKREVTVTLSVINKTNNLVRLEFPSTERIEILLRDQAGNVIERWSEDRAFEQTAGVVVINPKERIQYAERISTREMKPGGKYIIEASIFNHPEHSQKTQIKTK
ncbi:MAG: BsuPI-related putative proteinase inhibitor [Chthoniobacterales bacterium]